MNKFLREVLLKQRSDWYMSELKTELEEVSGESFSESTVWRALKRAGANWKLVSGVGI